MEESKSQLDLSVNLRIDLADLIDREQIKTLASLSDAIEALQARLVEKLETSGWKRSTSYQRLLVWRKRNRYMYVFPYAWSCVLR